MRGNVAANRFDEVGPEASSSKIAGNKQKPHKPDAVFGIISKDIDHGADLFVHAQDTVDEFVFIGFSGRKLCDEALKFRRTRRRALDNLEIFRISLEQLLDAGFIRSYRPTDDVAV